MPRAVNIKLVDGFIIQPIRAVFSHSDCKNVVILRVGSFPFLLYGLYFLLSVYGLQTVRRSRLDVYQTQSQQQRKMPGFNYEKVRRRQGISSSLQTRQLQCS